MAVKLAKALFTSEVASSATLYSRSTGMIRAQFDLLLSDRQYFGYGGIPPGVITWDGMAMSPKRLLVEDAGIKR